MKRPRNSDVLLDDQNVNLIAKKGAVNIKGSSVVAEQDLNIFGKEGVSVLSDVDTRYQQEESQKTKKGLMSSGGGFGFTVGKKKETIESDLTKERAARSQVGSLQGNTTIVTDGHYQQTGSVVTSRDGDVDIFAKSAKVEAARSEYENNYKRTVEQKGVTVAVNIPVVQAIQAVTSAVNSAKAVGTSKNDRINALGAVNAGFEAWRAGQQVGKLANALAQNPSQAMSQDVSVSIKSKLADFSYKVPDEINSGKQLPVVGKTDGYENQTANLKVSTGAESAFQYQKLKLDLKVEQSANEVISSLKATGELPKNYITKEEAQSKFNWKPGKALKAGRIESVQLALTGDVLDSTEQSQILGEQVNNVSENTHLKGGIINAEGDSAIR